MVARLRAAIARDRVHHAYLMTCSAPSVSRQVALALAGALNCLRSPGEGCAGADEIDPCDACNKIDGGLHPDVITLEREGAARLVSIETVRHQVVARVGTAPNEARMRVFIFDEATALAGPAANALLKTLEEPPARSMFVLSTVAPEQLLPTIRSRCQRLAFGPVSSVAVASDGDVDAALRLTDLARAVAAFDGQRQSALEVAAAVAAGKGETPGVVAAAADELHAMATNAARRGAAALARACALRGDVLARWQLGITTHNAHPQIAMEAVLAELAGIPLHNHEPGVAA